MQGQEHYSYASEFLRLYTIFWAYKFYHPPSKIFWIRPCVQFGLKLFSDLAKRG